MDIILRDLNIVSRELQGLTPIAVHELATVVIQRRYALTFADAVRVKGRARAYVQNTPDTPIQNVRREMLNQDKGKCSKPKARGLTLKFSVVPYMRDTKGVASSKLKMKLEHAGLGDQAIHFEDRRMTSDLFRLKIEECYPRLKNIGGYEILRSNGRGGDLLELKPPDTWWNPETLFSRSRGTWYLRPLQQDLSLEPVALKPSDMQLKEDCIHCGEEYPIGLIKNHVIECRRNPGCDSRQVGASSILHHELSNDSDEASDGNGHHQSTADYEECPKCGKVFDAVELVSHVESDSCSSAGNGTPEAQLILTLHPKTVTFCEVLSSLKEKVLQEDINRIIVHRDAIFGMGIGVFKKAARNESLIFQEPFIKFSGEPAIDGGGPLREFLTLFFKECISNLFEESVDGYTIRSGDENMMEIVGLAVGYSLLHNGPPFHYLSKHLIYRMFSDEDEQDYVSLKEIVADKQTRAVVDKLLSERAEDYRAIFDLAPDSVQELHIMQLCGISTDMIVEERRVEIAQLIIEHALFTSKGNAIRGIVKGLKMAKVFDLLKSFKKDAMDWLSPQRMTYADFMSAVSFKTPSDADERSAKENFLRLLEDEEAVAVLGGRPGIFRNILFFAASVEFIGQKFKLSIGYRKDAFPFGGTCNEELLLGTCADYEDFKAKFLMSVPCRRFTDI